MLPRCLRSMGGRELLDPIKKLLPPFTKRHVAEATFQTVPYKVHNLDQPPPASVTVKKEDALALYRNMTKIRRLENTIGELYRTKHVRGFCHLYIGLEAIACGIKAVMRPQDSVYTTYRCHAWGYLLGIPVAAMLSELTGHRGGVCRGKGGSMHLYIAQRLYTNAIVGAQVPVAAGAALANQYLRNGGVAIACYGDGGANQGQIFEAYNMAKLWHLPCIFLCENNYYGMGTSAHRSSASTDYYKRGDFIPGIWIDGSDVITVREAARYAIDHCTSGKGPLVLEGAGYRFVGHSMSDPGTSYRSREEIAMKRKTKDPLKLFKAQLIAKNLSTEAELKKIDSDAKKQVDDAMQQAIADKEIPLEELTADMYVKNLHPDIRNVDPFRPLSHKNHKPSDIPIK